MKQHQTPPQMNCIKHPCKIDALIDSAILCDQFIPWHSVGVVPFHVRPSAAPFSTHFNALLAGTVNPARLQPNVTTLSCSNPVTSVLKYPPFGYPGSVQVVPIQRVQNKFVYI